MNVASVLLEVCCKNTGFCDEEDQIKKEVILTAVATAGFCLLAFSYSQMQKDPDAVLLKEVAADIAALNPVIGDGASYDFVATHKNHVNEYRTKDGSLALFAAVSRSLSKSQSLKPSELVANFRENPENIIALGNDLLKKRSGQCDHMAAAVIAKVVDKIRNGSRWNSRLEVVGNGGHAFVIFGRNVESDLKEASSWGRRARLADTWLHALGVHQNYRNKISSGEFGVLSGEREIQKNLDFFDPNRLTVKYDFSSEELNQLAIASE